MIEFIVPTYDRPDALMCLIASLKAQTCPNWFCQIISDGAPMSQFRKVLHYIAGDARFSFETLKQRSDDWGHTPRNHGLSMAAGEWVCMTGEDNYYVPTFVDEVLAAANHQVKFIYCNMVHNYSASKNPLEQPYIAIECAPRWGKIDIGNAVFRTELAQLMTLDVTKETADGYYIEEYVSRFPGMIVKIPKLLYVHN